MIDKKKTTSSAAGEKPENPRPGSANKTKASIGPAIKDIKERFGEKKIPLDKDFADLIDIADSGRKAAGLSPEQTEDTDTGLRLLPTGQLAVKHDRELSVGENGLKVELWGEGGLNRGADGKLLVGLQTDSGLVRNNVGIKVGAGNGITVSGDSVAVKLATTTPGLSSENGLKVELWGEGGLNYSADGKLLVGLQTNSGLVRNNVGIKVGAGTGIDVNSSGVSVKANTETGIKVDANGVGINTQTLANLLHPLLLPIGSIILWAGTANNIPLGWKICDGTNGTVDLTGAFVLGGKPTTANHPKVGSNTKNTGSTTQGGTVNVNPFTLTLAQIPPHTHSYQKADGANKMRGEDGKIATHPSWFELTHSSQATTSAGGSGGQASSVQATASYQGTSHNHTIDVTPMHVMLCYIQRVG